MSLRSHIHPHVCIRSWTSFLNTMNLAQISLLFSFRPYQRNGFLYYAKDKPGNLNSD